MTKRGEEATVFRYTLDKILDLLDWKTESIVFLLTGWEGAGRVGDYDWYVAVSHRCNAIRSVCFYWGVSGSAVKIRR